MKVTKMFTSELENNHSDNLRSVVLFQVEGQNNMCLKKISTGDGTCYFHYKLGNKS